jgi:arginase
VCVGMRDVNELERERVLDSGLNVVWGNTSNFVGRLARILDKLKMHSTMLHLGVDNLDISIGQADKFSAPGGLDEDDMHQCIDAIM